MASLSSLTNEQITALVSVFEKFDEGVQKYYGLLEKYLKDGPNKHVLDKFVDLLLDRNNQLETAKYVSSSVYPISPDYLQKELLSLLPKKTQLTDQEIKNLSLVLNSHSEKAINYLRSLNQHLKNTGNTLASDKLIQLFNNQNGDQLETAKYISSMYRTLPNNLQDELQTLSLVGGGWLTQSEGKVINNTLYIFYRFIYYIQYFIFNISISFEQNTIKKIILEPEKRFINDNTLTFISENTEIVNQIRQKKQLISDKITRLQNLLDVCNRWNQWNELN